MYFVPDHFPEKKVQHSLLLEKENLFELRKSAPSVEVLIEVSCVKHSIIQKIQLRPRAQSKFHQGSGWLMHGTVQLSDKRSNFNV